MPSTRLAASAAWTSMGNRLQRHRHRCGGGEGRQVPLHAHVLNLALSLHRRIYPSMLSQVLYAVHSTPLHTGIPYVKYKCKIFRDSSEHSRRTGINVPLL